MTTRADINLRKKMKREAQARWLDGNLRRAGKEMSKAEMQHQLAEAVRNTAKLPVEGSGAIRGAPVK
jgi:hypothetical protein